MPKKSPNNPNIPKLSKINPINAYFNNINSIPRIKQIVPLNFVGRLKNAIVRCGPIINVIPIINNTLPSANNAESKMSLFQIQKENPSSSETHSKF